MALIRVFRSGGNSSAWVACAGVVSLLSTDLAFSNAISKLRSVSRLLRCAISAIASSSGSREGDARGGLGSIRRRVVDRVFLQSQRITLISCHKCIDRQAEVPSLRALSGDIRFDSTTWMEECVGNTDILIGFSWFRPVANVMTVGLKRAERHNRVNGTPYIVSPEAGVHYVGGEGGSRRRLGQLLRFQKLWIRFEGIEGSSM
jgi:hypothetical protein